MTPLRSFSAVLRRLTCGLELILAQPLGVGIPLFGRQPPASLWLDDRRHLIESFGREGGIDAIGAVLLHGDEGQPDHLPCDTATFIRADGQQIATVWVRNRAEIRPAFMVTRSVSEDEVLIS